MTRKQKRKIAIIVVLLLLLAMLGAYFAYFKTTKKLSVDFVGAPTEILPAPEFLYSFSGPETDRMSRPIGIDVVGNEVYTVDSVKQKIYVTDLEGTYKRSIGGTEAVVPLYIAHNPKDDNLYVTDRRMRTIHIYTKAGKYLKDFDPKLPKDELPKFQTNGVQWAPVALTFAKDGTMYVTEILNGHRLLIFDPSGKFKKSVGTDGLVNDAKKDPEKFQFPNSVKVFKDQVYVADSNNRRVQVFSKDGVYDRIIVTEGLPRGLDFLAKRSKEASETDKFVVADTLAHDGTIWSVKGEKIVNFGTKGVLEGQFSYPNDLAVGPKNLIFITDSANARVQVWGWPEEVSPVPLAQVAPYWRWCFAPLLLLPLLLLLRRKKFFVTEEFLNAMIALEMVDRMPERRRMWLVTPEVYERFKDVRAQDIDLGELLNATEHSESDAKAFMDKFEIDHETAVNVAIAKRVHVFCTDDAELRRLARMLEIDVLDHDEFIERFGSPQASKTTNRGE